jgi:chromosome segregation ATPase
MSEKLGLTGIDALEAEMRDRLAEANKAHEKTRAYLGAEINSKAELRNRFDIYVTEANRALAAKDARIAELSSAVAGKVQLIEPDPETIAWAEGVFAAEDDKDATITELSEHLAHKDARILDFMDICEDLSRKLEASRGRVAELEQQLKHEKASHELLAEDFAEVFGEREKGFARIAELEAAITPFAEAWHPDRPDEASLSDIEVDHYRAANRAMIKAEKE